MDKVIQFDGGYSRIGTIEVKMFNCCACKKDKPCIVIDASMDEYAPGAICRDCIAMMFTASDGPFKIDSGYGSSVNSIRRFSTAITLEAPAWSIDGNQVVIHIPGMYLINGDHKFCAKGDVIPLPVELFRL